MARALAASGIAPRLIFTDQQRVDPGDHELDGYPAVRLGCGGLENPHLHVKATTAALLPLLRTRPDVVVVQGDTSSALGAALAAAVAEVPVAHVEAGLRSHDPTMPWPEEEYRTAIDAIADLLFAPTELAAANLRREKVQGEIIVTGNSGIDALMHALAHLPLADGGASEVPRLLVTCHRRENWGVKLASVAAALREIAARANAEIHVLLHPNRHVSGEIKRLLSGCANIALEPPCSHAELIARMRRSKLILSDSGGMQEEAPALGVPLLVLREKTERPEGLATGNLQLVGTNPARIVDAVTRILRNPQARRRMSRPAMPYGDGQAAPRIAAVIAHWLEHRRSAVGPLRPNSSYAPHPSTDRFLGNS